MRFDWLAFARSGVCATSLILRLSKGKSNQSLDEMEGVSSQRRPQIEKYDRYEASVSDLSGKREQVEYLRRKILSSSCFPPPLESWMYRLGEIDSIAVERNAYE